MPVQRNDNAPVTYLGVVKEVEDLGEEVKEEVGWEEVEREVEDLGEVDLENWTATSDCLSLESR